jgi:hypothetical protein
MSKRTQGNRRVGASNRSTRNSAARNAGNYIAREAIERVSATNEPLEEQEAGGAPNAESREVGVNKEAAKELLSIVKKSDENDADTSAYSRSSGRYHARNTDDDDAELAEEVASDVRDASGRASESVGEGASEGASERADESSRRSSTEGSGKGSGINSTENSSKGSGEKPSKPENDATSDSSTSKSTYEDTNKSTSKSTYNASGKAAGSIKIDPNSTMSYAAIGENAPELPSALEEKSDSEKEKDTNNERAPQISSRRSRRPNTRDGQRGQASQKTRTGSAREADIKKPSLGTVAASAKTNSSRKSGFQNYTKGTSKPDAYMPLTENSGNYHIRGGGKLQIKSPAFIIVYGLILVAALALVAVALNSLLTTLSSGADRNPITLTQAETRAAIDENMPILINNLDKKVSDAVKDLSGDGRTIFQDERYVPDPIDPTAKGQGIIFMPQSVTDEFMGGFFEGSYVPYTPGELQEFFNGAWSLEMMRGDLGGHHKLRYVNLNAVNVRDEMKTLADFQGLSGEGSTIAAEGTDPRGNFVIQGTKAVGERIYYWKIAACSFNEIYRGRSIPNNAAYVSCTVSDFDFYTGSDEIK